MFFNDPKLAGLKMSNGEQRKNGHEDNIQTKMD